jgi:nucleotide-binding universal stress UspA family protein
MKTLEVESTAKKIISIQKVLVALDLSDHSTTTVTYAAEIAKCFDASLTIVHVCEPVPLQSYATEAVYRLIENQRIDLQRLLDEYSQKTRKPGVACEAVLLVGDAAEEILALARDMNADLIVVASLHSSLLGRLFNLNKAPRLMHRALCPVLFYCDKNT